MTNHHISRAHPLRALTALAAALAIVAASLAAAAPPASAASIPNACRGVVDANACLRFDDRGFGLWDAVVGIDVFMPEQYAREIIACGARFQAELWGEDFSIDDFITNMALRPGWPSTGPTGLGAEFAVPVNSSQLNEDPEGQDELYARISYYDCHTGRTRAFRTGTVRHSF